MTSRIDRGQWAAMEDVQRQRFRARLVEFISQQFAALPDASARTPEEVADAALQFADSAGAMTEAQVARVAVLLVAVNRLRLPPEHVARLRAVLTRPDATADERLDDAARFLGIAA